MRFAIIYGKDDPAGNNIIENLKKDFFLPQTPIIQTKKHPIYADDLSSKKYPELKEIEFIVFATTHKSEKGEPSLSLHAPGNWRSADLGGKQGKLSMTSAYVLKYLFKELNKNANEDKEIKEKYNITLECTHHGPSIDIPCCFIEIGSNEEYWKDKQAGKIIAKTIASLQNYNPNQNIKPNQNWIPSFLIGGGHYNQAANKIMLRTKYAVGHIIPRHQLPITNSIINEAEKKTQEQIKIVLLDWKGLGKYKQETIKILERANLRYEKVQNILKSN